MAIDWQRLGTALSGAGAGLQGQGAQWRQGVQQERALQAQQQQQLSEERRRAAAQDLYGLSTLLGQGRTDAAMALMNNREHDIMELGGESVMTSYMRDLMQAGEFDEAKAFADMALQQAQAAGYIQVPERQTISGSDIVGGNVVQQNPDGTFTTQQVLSPEQMQSGHGANAQFGGQERVMDEAGNLFFASTARDPATGQMQTVFSPIGPDRGVAPQGRLQLVNDLGQTAQQRTQEAGLQAGTTAASQAAVRASEAAFDQLGPIRSSIGNYDELISMIDAGEVNTGPILSRLPSFRENAIKLDNLQARMGLDVINMATFGALSDSELRFALDTAVPQGLSPDSLREWAVRKRDAQTKLTRELERAASYLGTPGNTIPGYLEMMRNQERQAPRERPQNVGPGLGPSAGADMVSGGQAAPQRFIFNPETGQLEPR